MTQTHERPQPRPEGWTELRADVRGEVFNERGKWKYTVRLDYTLTHELTSDSGYVDPGVAADHALAAATARGTSEVAFDSLPAGWTLVVPDPPNGWPVMVTSSAVSGRRADVGISPSCSDYCAHTQPACAKCAPSSTPRRSVAAEEAAAESQRPGLDLLPEVGGPKFNARDYS